MSNRSAGHEPVKAGDRVSVPFSLACGTCNCTAGWTSACLRANLSGQPGACYGYPQMGPYLGGQAGYLRVPWADFNLLELPQGTDHEQDFTPSGPTASSTSTPTAGPKSSSPGVAS